MIKPVIRTHTYWMTIKEYKKMCKNKPKNKPRNIKVNTDNTIIRTHIHFI